MTGPRWRRRGERSPSVIASSPRHRAALEAGADPALVVAWSQQVQQHPCVTPTRQTKRRSTGNCGVRLTYDHVERTVLAETRPTSSVCVVSVSEEGLGPNAYAHALFADFDLAGRK
jgi:hypothetical protein